MELTRNKVKAEGGKEGGEGELTRIGVRLRAGRRTGSGGSLDEG